MHAYQKLPGEENASEGVKKEMKQIPLFPTKTAKEKDYPFIKPVTHFEGFEEAILHEEENHHSVYTAHKKSRPGKKNLKRDSHTWYNITTTSVSEENANVYFSLCRLAGEIYSFELGNEVSPKERTIIDGKGRLSRASKGIADHFDLIDFFDSQIGSRKDLGDDDFLENTGRVFYNKWVNQENDLNPKNIWVSFFNRQLGIIDPGQTFAPLTLPFLKKIMYKQKTVHGVIDTTIEQFKHLHGKVKEFKNNCNELCSAIKTMKVEDMGTFHLWDYDNAPFVGQFLPLNWVFNQDEMRQYSAWLAKYQRFLNEKHFAAIKSQITQQVKHTMVDIHVADQKYNARAHDLIRDNLDKTLKVVRESKDFMTYFDKHKLDVVKTVFYETLQFLEKNKHYRYPDSESSGQQWKQLIELILKDTETTFKKLGYELSHTDKDNLKIFAFRLRKNAKDELTFVSNFYHDQGMKRRNLHVFKQINLLHAPLTKPINMYRPPAKKAAAAQSQHSKHKCIVM